MIKRVHITGYKSLREVEVRLQPLSVLFGPNAAGKSNFLDALQLMSRTATSRTLTEAFDPPYRGTPLDSFSFGLRGLAGQLEEKRGCNSQSKSMWNFRIERSRVFNPVKEVRHIGLMGEGLAAFLNTLRAVDPRQFAAIEKSLHTLVPQIERIDVQPNAFGEVELKLQENGVPVPARLVSEGTLRMLGLLAVASSTEPSTLIAFEEPENGIHPRRIRLLAEFHKTRTRVGGTQFIVTTHSPLLPDLLPAEALFVCRRRTSGTLVDRVIDRGPLFQRTEINRRLEDKEEPAAVLERLVRGDFDD